MSPRAPATKRTSPPRRTYLPVLKAVYRAIHKADRRAKVVLAGLHNVSWKTLAQLYKAALKGYADRIALHPYTEQRCPHTRNRAAQPSRDAALRWTASRSI